MCCPFSITVPNTGPQTCLTCASSKFSFSKYAQILNSVKVSSVVVLLQKPSQVELVICPEWKHRPTKILLFNELASAYSNKRKLWIRYMDSPKLTLPVSNWTPGLLTGVKGVKICSAFRIRSELISNFRCEVNTTTLLTTTYNWKKGQIKFHNLNLIKLNNNISNSKIKCTK